MGAILSQGEKVKTENEFWTKYYQRTGNYSVGPAVTVSFNSGHNAQIRKETIRVLNQYKCKGGYSLPYSKR